MPTLILPPRKTPDTDALAHAAYRRNWKVWAAPGWRFPADFTADEPVLYADVLFADVAASPLGLALLEPAESWADEIPDTWTRREIRTTLLEEVRGLPGPYFVKPFEAKLFPARVYTGPADLPSVNDFDDETAVILSEPVTWAVEYRCFVLNDVVQAMSPYLRFGELALAENGKWETSEREMREAARFAASVLKDPDVRLPPAVVLDFGSISGRGWAVVEPNAAWGSGLYGCNPDAVLPVLHRSCIPRASLSQGDEKWVRPFREVIG